MLQVSQLRKRFKNHEVLRGIDISVAAGEVLGIIGASGSGKSTLLRCINFLETPESGVITLDERSIDVSALGKEDIRYMQRNTGMVFQGFNLFKYKTALENITEGLITVQRMPHRAAMELAENLLDQVGMLSHRDYYPSKKSGGQQQRVAIARSLALKPRALLFDEPTSALDPETIGEVLSVIKQIAAAREHAVIIVSHEMSFIYEIADRVAFMDGGEILEYGTPLDVFGAPRTERARQFVSRINLGNNYVI
ncbi:MAG: amino acid ABC transporter ATP-binding protein [Oscillospiraceae bacterium]|jgi:ABC-type polar amino acid transport system ATPase subunit|nr:amino acid ABC transporter ATP-binding protein [Oscillospiraceae bacterium]